MSPAPPLFQFSRSAIASKPGDDGAGASHRASPASAAPACSASYHATAA
jgi:hypothetical protein